MSLVTVPLWLIASVSLTTTFHFFLNYVSDLRKSLEEVTEVLEGKPARGYIKNNFSTKETKSTWVIKISTMILISFVLYSRFNFSVLVLVT